MCKPAEVDLLDDVGTLGRVWAFLCGLVSAVLRYLRILFVSYGPLPSRTHPKTGMLVDARMADTVDEAVKRAEQLHFPPGFLFGSATAAYQVEGGLTNCTWHAWEERQTRADGEPTVNGGKGAGVACEMWRRFEEDVEHMRDLGLKCYRFSVEWSRVEPREGEFDEAAIERYRSWCVLLRESGIEPMVTLHHFTEPKWWDEKGGWEVRDNVAQFARFAAYVAARLAPHVTYWCTTNEMNGFAVCGWIAGVHPPGKRDEVFTLCSVVRNMLLGHRLASAEIRAAAAALPHEPVIMMALNHIWFQADNWFPLSNLSALILNVVYNFAIPDALFTGRFSNFPVPLGLLARACGWGDDLRALRGSADMLGVNHYYRSVVSFGRNSTRTGPASVSDLYMHLPFGLLLRANMRPGFEKSDMGWDLTPSSLERLVLALWDRYNVPIVVTESGIADAEMCASSGKETCFRRTRYLSACLEAVSSLAAKGVDVRGYVIWTLLDNFEWAEGFRPRFGLLHNCFETQTRTKRHVPYAMLQSVFRRAMAQHGIGSAAGAVGLAPTLTR